MTNDIKIFVVLTAYYKHGEANTEIFTDVSSLLCYLSDQIQKYDEDFVLESDEYDVDDDEEIVYALIKAAVSLGKNYVQEQYGWGILKITEVCIDNNIQIYEY